MKILSIQSFCGRNIFSHKPVIKIIVDLEEFHDIDTSKIDGFNDRLIKLFPGLYQHHCSLGREGGFIERLKEGTYLSHVTEHLALELQSILGYDVYFGKARLKEEPSVYQIIYEFMNERCGIDCGKAAFGIVSTLASGTVPDVDAILGNLKKASTEYELGPSSRAIFEEAKRRGIPVMRIGNESLMQLGYGKYLRLVEASLTDATSCITADIASNKHLTKKILSDNMIPVPCGDVAYTPDSAVSIAEEIGYPVVVKPFDGNQGKGVTLNITNAEQLRKAYDEAIKYSKAVIVEKYIKGKDYRILVVGGKVSAVSERRPPCVVGDGIHSVKELVDIENMNELRGDDHEKPLTKILLDNVALQVLARNGMDENYVPAPGQVVTLRDNGNISTGGTARSCTEEIHPYNSMIAVKAAKLIGLDIAGVDMTTEDISVPINETNGAIIEINAAPGLRMHIFPTEGKPDNVASDIIDMLFPKGRPYTIPIVSVTGTNGKTTTTRLIGHTLSLKGLKVGMTTTSGIYVGDKCILEGDNTGPISAGIVLSSKEVEAAVLETARGGIIKRGLGYDLADVGVITNISDDHLGLDGINTLEDLAFVKSLVIEAVKPDGHSVINADDAMARYFMNRASGNIILFSKTDSNPLLLEHVKKGGKAVYVRENKMVISEGNKGMAILSLEDVPITYGGKLECNIENALAAVSALYALNVSVTVIRKGLRTFRPDADSNPGRMNLFNMGYFSVMLDYGHNVAGYRAVIDFAEKLQPERLVGVIGMPGDRLDSSIGEVGEICAKAFSTIYIKEDRDLRGRRQGEVAQILYNSVIEKGFKKENVNIILSEEEALETAILNAKPGDLIIMFYEQFEPALRIVEKFKQEMEQNLLPAAAAAGNTAG